MEKATRKTIDEVKFIKTLVKMLICKIVPIALREAAAVHPDQNHKDKLEKAALLCETRGTRASAVAAERVASLAYDSIGVPKNPTFRNTSTMYITARIIKNTEYIARYASNWPEV